MQRAIASSLLSLTVVVTLLWGGCISCSQFFMFQTGEKSCCNKSGQCERPTKNAPTTDCRQMPLEPQGFASAHADLAAVGLIAEVVDLSPVLSSFRIDMRRETRTVEHS